jgi:elongator complex protein 6
LGVLEECVAEIHQGLDLEKLAAKKRFAFVDGLSGLSVPKMKRAAVGKVGEKVLSNSALENVSEVILGSIRNLKGDGERVLLVIDQLDLLLASGGDQIGAVNLGDMLMNLRVVRLKGSRW